MCSERGTLLMRHLKALSNEMAPHHIFFFIEVSKIQKEPGTITQCSDCFVVLVVVVLFSIL
jgi:hypothetical protein